MGILEFLIGTVGSSVAGAALKMWLKDNELAAAAVSKIGETLVKKIPDSIKRNRVEREFEAIGDESAKSVFTLLKKEATDLSDDRLKKIAVAASETLNNVNFTTAILVANDLDKEKLVEFFLEQTGAAGGNPGLAGHASASGRFPEEEQIVYRRILTHASQLIVDMAATFPNFEAEVSRETLRRLGAIAEEVIEGMNLVTSEQADAFEADYRNACVRKWDRLEIFGVDLNESSQRYNLSIAYITLTIETLIKNEYTANLKVSEDESESLSMPANEALAKYPRLLVRGPAGSGKTTLLQWVAVFSAARKLEDDLDAVNNCVPFLLKLRTFVERPLPTPGQFTLEASKALGSRTPENWVHERMSRGDAILLVDGLDEINSEMRRKVREWLDDIIGAYPKARYLVTTRPHAADAGWMSENDFVDSELQEMERSDVDEFIEHWHKAIAHGISDEDEKLELVDLSEDLKQKLRINRSILRLATSPLLCAMLCALHRQRARNLPRDRIELYDACIDMFFRRDEQRDVDSVEYLQLTGRQKSRVIQDFAWWMIRNEKSTVDRPDAIGRFNRSYNSLNTARSGGQEQGKAVLKLFLDRVGLIRELSHNEIDFPHRTFQEFLAAKGAIDEDDLNILVRNAHDDQWREVAILAVGQLSAKPATKMIIDLLVRGDSEPRNKHTLYLTAVSALEVLVSFDKDVSLQEEVASRLEQIVPPRTITEAKVLASAGELVTPFLKWKKEYKVKEAAACARALALVGGDLAHTLLEDYAKDSRIGVRHQVQESIKSAASPNDILRIGFKRSQTIYLFSVGSVENLDGIQSCVQVENFHASCCNNLVDFDLLGACEKLRIIEISWCPVADISFLAKCKNIEEVDFSGFYVEDLSVLCGLPFLKKLALYQLGGVDFLSFGGLPTVESLTLGSMSLPSSYSLTGCPSLACLSLYYIKSEDLSWALNFQGLRTLRIRDCGPAEFDFETTLPQLESLTLEYVKITNAPKISNFTKLKSLCLDYTSVSDLGFVKDLPILEYLEVSNKDGYDLSPVAECRSLRSIDVGIKSIEELHPLIESESIETISVRHPPDVFVDLNLLQSLFPNFFFTRNFGNGFTLKRRKC